MWWEYGFSQDNSLWATNITTLNTEGLKLLPSSNSKAERILAKFDWRANNVAKCRNFKFTVKLIHVESKMSNDKVEPLAWIIIKPFNEIRWYEKQKIKQMR